MATKSQEKPGPTLTEQILSATQADLDSIDETIQKLVDEIAEQERSVDGLRAIRRAIEIRLHGKPERKKREASTADNGQVKESLADVIHDLLQKEGSMPVPAIAERLCKPPAIIGMAIGRKAEWFVRKNGEVSIATT